MKFRCDKVIASVQKHGAPIAQVEKLKQSLPKKWKL